MTAFGQAYQSPTYNNLTIRGAIGGPGIGTGVGTALGQAVTGSGGIALATGPAISPLSIDNVVYCSAYATLALCYAALPSTGGKMLLPPNTVVAQSATLNITNPNVTLECPGWGTILQRSGGLTTQIVHTTGDGDSVRGCTFDDASYTGGTGGALQMSSVNGAVEHNQFINPGASESIQLALDGANARASWNKIVGNNSSSNTTQAIWTNNTVKVDHNTISYAGIDAIAVRGNGTIVDSNHLFGNHCYTGVGGGQLVVYSGYSGIVISNNTIDQGCAAQSHGMELAGGADVVGNTVQNQQWMGATVHSGPLNFVGNVFKNNNQTTSNPVNGAVTVNAGASHLNFVGNRFVDDQGSPTQATGIYIAAGVSDYITIVGDDLSGNINGPISDNSTGTNKIFNNNLPNTVTFGQPTTRDNRIINPCFSVDQQNEGASYPTGGGLRQIMDGWTATQPLGSFTEQRSAAVTSPGCGAMGLHAVLTIQRTAGSTDVYNLSQKIEGDDLQDLNYGTSAAKAMMLEFCVKNSVTGTYSFVLTNLSANYYYAQQFSLTGGTQQCLSYFIPGDTAHAISNATTGQFQLSFNMGSGSSELTSTVGAWTTGTPWGVVGDTPFNQQTITTTTLDLSAVRLYIGQITTPWARRSATEELAKAQRRYQKSFPIGTAVAQNAGQTGAIVIGAPYASGTNDNLRLPLTFVPMRAAPTVTFYSPSAATANCYNLTGAADIGAGAATLIGTNSLIVTCPVGAGSYSIGDEVLFNYTLDSRI